LTLTATEKSHKTAFIMSQQTLTETLPALQKTDKPSTTTVQPLSKSHTDYPSTDTLRSLPKSRSGSHKSGKSTLSNETTMKKGEELSSGVISISMDENDATTVGRTTTESRRSSSRASDHHPSETNDTEHENSDDEDRDAKQIETQKPFSTSRRSNSSSTTGRPNINVPVVMLMDRRRSASTSSIDSDGSSLRQRTSSVESASRGAKRKHKSQPSDPVETTETTGEDVSRRHSATEFQKFRDQLHSIPSNPALRGNTEEQLHPNPHHPKTKTEILRIERIYTPIALPSKHHVSDVTNYDVLIPRFSPAYPVLLRDFGITDGEWNAFITRVNRSCMEAFDPFRWNNLLVNMFAVLSFWISEWFMPNLSKRV